MSERDERPSAEGDATCPHPRLALIYSEPNGRWACEECREVLALRPVFAVPAEIRLGSCCVNVGTDECACDNPTNWGRLTPPTKDNWWCSDCVVWHPKSMGSSPVEAHAEWDRRTRVLSPANPEEPA